MSIDTERLKILNEMKHLQHRLSLLNNAESLKLNNKTDTNISQENIDFLFGLAHLHETDYKNYVFIKKFIKYSLKERLINLKKELNTISVHKEILSKVLNNPELNKNDYSLSKEKHNMDFLINREKDCINKIQDIKNALSEFKILPQNEPFFKNEDDKIILNKWLIMKRAEFDFKNLGKSDEERNNEIELLKSDIEMKKREMDEVIAE